MKVRTSHCRMTGSFLTCHPVYASFDLSPDPDVVVSADAQLDMAGSRSYASYLVTTGISTTLYAKFNPDGPVGKSLFDKPGVDLFFSNDPLPKLLGTYKLEILREKKASLHKEDERIWSGESVKECNNLAGVHQITF